MADRALNHLCRPLQEIYAQWFSQCQDAGLTARAIVTWRDPADQAEAEACGLSNAGPGQSPHNCCAADGTPASRAFDFGIFEADGSYIIDGTDARYAQAALIAKNLGLVSGDSFPDPDYDHIELANWKTLDLQ